MIKRFLIALIIIGLLVGGLAYFQLVFKPKMIKEFLSSQTPPAATITAEPAKVEEWIDRLPAIGTLIASQGVEVASQIAGIVTGLGFESGQDVPAGVEARAARHLRGAGGPRQRPGDAAGGQCRLQAPNRPSDQGGRLGGQRRYGARQTRYRGSRPQPHQGVDRAEVDPLPVRRAPGHSPRRTRSVHFAGPCDGFPAGAGPDLGRLPDAGAERRQAAGGRED